MSRFNKVHYLYFCPRLKDHFTLLSPLSLLSHHVSITICHTTHEKHNLLIQNQWLSLKKKNKNKIRWSLLKYIKKIHLYKASVFLLFAGEYGNFFIFIFLLQHLIPQWFLVEFNSMSSFILQKVLLYIMLPLPMNCNLQKQFTY